MLTTGLLHPQILAALARAGHGSKVLVADGNYPCWTRRGPNADVVHLNLAPGVVSALDVLKVLREAIPIEAAEVMTPGKGSPDPPIFLEFRALLPGVELALLEREAFYRAASTRATRRRRRTTTRSPEMAMAARTPDRELSPVIAQPVEPGVLGVTGTQAALSV